MSIHLDITDSNIKEKLATLPEKMLDYAEEVLLDQAHLIVGLAQINCPVDTGTLRDTGRVERGGQGQHWREVKVRFGGYLINPKHPNDGTVNYALYVEQRTPFLRPAVEEVKPIIEEMIKANVVQKANE